VKITLKTNLMIHKSEEDYHILEGFTVRDLLEDYLETCPAKARKMLVDRQGVFRGVVMLNMSRADMAEPLREGDELLLLAMLNM
jgi:molybdopterin converting factor small subunit